LTKWPLNTKWRNKPTFSEYKVISVALWRRIFLAKNHPVKRFPPPGLFFERIIIRQRILLAKNLTGKEFFGEEFSALKKITGANNSPAKNSSEELSGEES
jgi:hypothetical protein